MGDMNDADADADAEWLNTEIDAGDATGPAAAALLRSVAEALSDAPTGKRYDIELTVEERADKVGE